MSKVRYNRELLDSCIERDRATLIGEYEKLNRDCKIKFICSCGKEGEKIFKNVIRSSGFFCKLCSKSKRLDKVKATNLEKLGVEYPTQSKEVRDKVKSTNLEKLGVEYPSQSKEVKDKIKNTNLKNL
jgi:hypothetical protein